MQHKQTILVSCEIQMLRTLWLEKACALKNISDSNQAHKSQNWSGPAYITPITNIGLLFKY